MNYRVEVEVVAPVRPTEDPERVAEAVHNLFPRADVEPADGELIARTHSLERLSESLSRQRILETARSRLLDSIEGDTISFTLDKQAAAAGVANFGLERPGELGDLAVAIRVREPDPVRLVEWLTGEGAAAEREG